MLSAGIKPDGQNYDILLRAVRDCGIGDPALASNLLLRGREESASKRGQRSRPIEGTCRPGPLDVDAFERRVLSDVASDLSRLTLRSDSTHTQLIPASPPTRALTSASESAPLPNLLDPSTCRSDVVALATTSAASDRLALIGNLDGFLSKMSHDGVKPSVKTLTLLAEVTEPSSQSVRTLIDVADQGGVKLDAGFFNTLIRKAAKAGDVQGVEVRPWLLESLDLKFGLFVCFTFFPFISVPGHKDADAGEEVGCKHSDVLLHGSGLSHAQTRTPAPRRHGGPST